MTRALPVLALALALAACSRSSHGSPAARDAAPAARAPAAASIDAAPPRPDAAALVPGPDGVARGPVPAALDARVAAVLAEPVPDHVLVRFAEVARGDDPRMNDRWDLDRDGRLWFVRHSDDKNAQAFDRPLPAKPSLHLDAKHLREVLSSLAAQGFYDHPGYETVPGATGGTIVIVRARRREGDPDVHTVIYEVSRPDLLDFLEAVTVSL